MIEDIEKEIQARADARAFDVLIKLLDLFKKEIAEDMRKSTSDMLDAYVRIKLIRHRVKKAINYGWYADEQSSILERKFRELTFDAKEARRKYYESKRRDEARGYA